MTLPEAADLFIELKLHGYEDEFESKQKLFPDAAAKWRRTSLGNRSVAIRIWRDLLGDGPIDALNEYDVEDVVGLIGRLPNKHGKAWKVVAGYRKIIEHVDRAEESARAAAEKEGRDRPELSNAQREALVKDAAIPRVAVDTFLRHVRTINAVGTMMQKFGRLKFNPFWLCSYTTDEANLMKKRRGAKTRMCWDDRISDLRRSPKFQEELADPGDPLFWAPLMARAMGFRSEESLQLGPEDFQVRSSIPVVHVHGGEGNSIKSDAADRWIPLHRALIELGILQLVERAADRANRDSSRI